MTIEKDANEKVSFWEGLSFFATLIAVIGIPLVIIWANQKQARIRAAASPTQIEWFTNGQGIMTDTRTGCRYAASDGGLFAGPKFTPLVRQDGKPDCGVP